MKVTEARSAILESMFACEMISEPERARLQADESADVDLASLQIDSIKIVDWCMDLETKLNREVQVEELVENDSLNKLARYLAA